MTGFRGYLFVRGPYRMIPVSLSPLGHMSHACVSVVGRASHSNGPGIVDVVLP